jgi:hypothetical protein
LRRDHPGFDPHDLGHGVPYLLDARVRSAVRADWRAIEGISDRL